MGPGRRQGASRDLVLSPIGNGRADAPVAEPGRGSSPWRNPASHRRRGARLARRDERAYQGRARSNAASRDRRSNAAGVSPRAAKPADRQHARAACRRPLLPPGCAPIMTEYLVRRVLLIVPVLLLISVLAFIVMEAPPGDFVTSYMMRQAEQGALFDGAGVEEGLRAMWGLDKPWYVRYLRWLGNLAARQPGLLAVLAGAGEGDHRLPFRAQHVGGPVRHRAGVGGRLSRSASTRRPGSIPCPTTPSPSSASSGCPFPIFCWR